MSQGNICCPRAIGILSILLGAPAALVTLQGSQDILDTFRCPENLRYPGCPGSLSGHPGPPSGHPEPPSGCSG